MKLGFKVLCLGTRTSGCWRFNHIVSTHVYPFLGLQRSLCPSDMQQKEGKCLHERPLTVEMAAFAFVLVNVMPFLFVSCVQHTVDRPPRHLKTKQALYIFLILPSVLFLRRQLDSVQVKELPQCVSTSTRT